MDGSSPLPTVYIPFAVATSRTAAVNIVFSAIFLLVGAGLCLFGRRLWRLTCALAFALGLELIAAGIVFNKLGSTGFSNSYSAADNDLVVFGIIIGVGLAALVLSLALPVKWYAGWWIGWAMLGPGAGISIAFTMMFLKGGEGLLVDSLVGRWIIIAIFGVLGKLGVTLTKWRGATLASCIIGTWLLALGIDLIVNTNRGASLGLRKLLDENRLHMEALREYAPPLSTRLLFALSWVIALLLAALQDYTYSNRHFLQVPPSLQQRHLRYWFFPYMLRHRRTDSPDKHPVLDKELDTPPADETNGPDTRRSSRSLHSQQPSTPDSRTSTDHDYLERGSLASGSELRTLTQNYQRALELLQSEDDHGTEPTVRTTVVPIMYRPTPSHANNFETSAESPTSPARHTGGPTSLTAPRFRPGLSPVPGAYGRQGIDEVPDIGAYRRADSDRGTTYSVPLTNITSSEYVDRDNGRPPSWNYDLPWHPSMLRGDLDPATLPQHPPDNRPAVQAAAPMQPATDRLQNEPPPTTSPEAAPMIAGPLTSRRKLPDPPEEEFEIINAEDAPLPAGRTGLQISQPFQMGYASRPTSRDETPLPSPLSILTGSNRNIPKASRTPTRERHMFPSEDDLPDHNRAAPEGRQDSPVGHSRFHTSETAVDRSRRPTRDDYSTEVDTSGDDEGEDGDSSHASYSMTNFKAGKNRKVSRPKDSAPQQYTPTTDSYDSSGILPTRPITQSDMTPHLQILPLPSRPRLVQNDNAPVSNHASYMTGTPRTSTAHPMGQTSTHSNQASAPPSEASQSTARPGEAQRTSMELDHLPQASQEDATASQSRRVRFFDTNSWSKAGKRSFKGRLLGK